MEPWTKGPWGGDSQLGASNSQSAVFSAAGGLHGPGDRKDWQLGMFPQQDQWTIAL